MSGSTTQSVPSYAGAKLYYSPGSCSAAAFIAAYSAGLKGLQVEQVDLKSHITNKGNQDFYNTNPKGNVPALLLADGTLLNEGAAILQYIADQKPDANLGASWGTLERYRLINALNHISSEVHPQFGAPLFVTEATRETVFNRANKKLAYLDKEIKGKWYVGDHFTVADIYLYVCLTWLAYANLSLDNYPNVKKYFDGIKELPNVQAAQKLIADNPDKLD